MSIETLLQLLNLQMFILLGLIFKFIKLKEHQLRVEGKLGDPDNLPVEITTHGL